MRSIFVSFFVVPFLLGCNSDDGPLDGVNLRIKNSSNRIFDEIYVDSGTESHTFGPLVPRMSSPYEEFDQLYRYAYVRIISGDSEYIFQPIDYVGETPLSPGRYTYKLEIDDPDFIYGVSLELLKD
ncbi:MAG: hypothetical protein P8X57_08015 [Cyclobacteriaceae bacterium]